MATPTEYTKQEWKIAVLEDDLAALQEEIAALKARVERLRIYGRAAFRYVTTPYVNDDDPDGYRHFRDLMTAQMQLEKGDLAGADPAPDAAQEGE